MTPADQSLPDPVAEGTRIAEAAAERGLPLRVLGGVAVAILCPSSRRPPLQRDYADIDLATRGAAKEGVASLMESLGYAADREFNTLHGHRRLYFWDEARQRQVDVFVDEANLCHRIGFRDRLELVPLTLSLADLTVLKLQVVETNHKDYLDICAIFTDHDLSEDENGVNFTYIADLCASNWGLWRTLGMVAERSERFARELPGFEAGELVAGRLRRLRGALDGAPKTRGWKLRARVGERKRWYELPEEVH
ncbi:MAG: nucleotidyltransferase family protein [Actinomycetota bacterium]|nr:nucleotidyltransferase family protein [Actinomycetota bacterium]